METKSIKELECELIKEKVSYERTVLSIQLLNLIFNGGILNRSDIIQLVGETMTYKTSLASVSYSSQVPLFGIISPPIIRRPFLSISLL